MGGAVTFSNIPTLAVSFSLSGRYWESNRVLSLSSHGFIIWLWFVCSAAHPSNNRTARKLWQRHLTPTLPLTSEQTLLCEASLVIIRNSHCLCEGQYFQLDCKLRQETFTNLDLSYCSKQAADAADVADVDAAAAAWLNAQTSLCRVWAASMSYCVKIK